jgi:hypothetical protein
MNDATLSCSLGIFNIVKCIYLFFGSTTSAGAEIRKIISYVFGKVSFWDHPNFSFCLINLSRHFFLNYQNYHEIFRNKNWKPDKKWTKCITVYSTSLSFLLLWSMDVLFWNNPGNEDFISRWYSENSYRV